MSNELTRYGSDGAPLAGGYWVTYEEAAAEIERLRARVGELAGQLVVLQDQNNRNASQALAAREDSSHWAAAVRDALDTAEANKYDGGGIARMALQVIAKALREAIDAARGEG